MRIRGQLLEQRGVLKGPDDAVDAELLLEDLGLLGVAHECGDIKGVRVRMREQSGEDGAPDVAWALSANWQQCAGVLAHTCRADNKDWSLASHRSRMC